MNCWRKIVNKFDMSPEDAKKNQEHSYCLRYLKESKGLLDALFFSQRSQRSYGNHTIAGIARIAEQIFQRSWRSQRLYGNRAYLVMDFTKR